MTATVRCKGGSNASHYFSAIYLTEYIVCFMHMQRLLTGNHVIQKSITVLFSMAKEAQENREEDLCSFFLRSLDPIVDEIGESVEEISKHPYGCRAVQRLVEQCIEPQKAKILDSIIACQRSLLVDQYGNYVVQKVLTHGRVSDRDAIFKSITANKSVIKFSKQKQASNVVESTLRLGDADQRQQIVQEMLSVSSTMFSFFFQFQLIPLY